MLGSGVDSSRFSNAVVRPSQDICFHFPVNSLLGIGWATLRSFRDILGQFSHLLSDILKSGEILGSF